MAADRLPPAGVALRGRLWPGGEAPVVEDGVACVDGAGVLTAFGPVATTPVPSGATRLGGPGRWVGPGLRDDHVHLAFGSAAQMLAGGVVAVRDLGAPPPVALRWSGLDGVTVAGPLLTAPGGYPMNGWGAAGFALPVSGPAGAPTAVAAAAEAGASVVKVALEPAGGQPVLPPAVVAAVVAAAADLGLSVTAHALTVATVLRALDAGVAELAHTPVEPLPVWVVDRLAGQRVGVVSTMEALSGYPDSAVAANAAALVAAGVDLRYGTDLGNAGTRPGSDPRELRRLAAAGLGPLGALRAATGVLVAGGPARLVLLTGDPVTDPKRWRRPLAVVSGSRCHLPVRPERSRRAGP